MVIKITLLSFVGFFGFLALFSDFYLSRLSFKYLEEAEKYLKGSSLVIFNKKHLDNGFLGRTYRLIQLSSGLIDEEFYIKRGALEREEVSNFPHALKRKITLPNKVLQVSGLLALILAIGANYSGALT
ncbi:hypothetical protein [Pseudomonas sp. RIT-PI-AD]|uniref:hypothetical protein n=1 Tax=Pseudomonas sp. RIT-PI-AD TaxID=3035294 RepID=UPI0021DAE9EE|nr:hypothetical protein [Pseudomonas sp. RIT-PI-AD]